jgi:hypothetical protein
MMNARMPAGTCTSIVTFFDRRLRSSRLALATSSSAFPLMMNVVMALEVLASTETPAYFFIKSFMTSPSVVGSTSLDAPAGLGPRGPEEEGDWTWMSAVGSWTVAVRTPEGDARVASAPGAARATPLPFVGAGARAGEGCCCLIL